MPWLIETFKPRRVIPWYRKLNPLWALFGNDDDSIYGDERWRAGRPKTIGLAVKWWFRNPFHNLFFYVIGVADRRRSFWSHPDRLWGTVDGWTFHWLQVDGLRWKFPFASYRSARISAYAGWRPYGAFGFKFQIKRNTRK